MTARPGRARVAAWLALWAALWLVPWLVPGPAAARTPPTAPTARPGAVAADLVYMHREIYTMRAPVAGVSPQDRVVRALERIQALPASARLEPVEAVAVVRDGERAVALVVAGQTLFTAYPRDVDTEGGATLDEVVLLAQARLAEALRARAQLDDRRVLLRGLAQAMGGAAFVWLAGWLLLRARRAVTRRIQALVQAEASVHRLFGADWSDVGLRLVAAVMRLVGWLLTAGLAYLWLAHVLRQFDATAPLSRGMGRLLADGSAAFGLLLWRLLPDLGMIVLIVGVARFVAWALGWLFEGVAAGHFRLPGVHRETARATRRLAVFGVWGLAAATAYPYIPGSQSDAFRGLSVFLGFMFTLGSSGVVSQWMQGLVLVYSRALRVGEFVRIGGVEGTVKELGSLSVKLTDPTGNEVTLPNSTVVSGSVVNHARQAAAGMVQASVSVSIGYDVPWRQVQGLLVEAARRSPGVADDPPPLVLQRELGDFSVIYTMTVHVLKPALRAQVVSQLHGQIRDTFDAAGVEILSPHVTALRMAGAEPVVPAPSPSREAA